MRRAICPSSMAGSLVSFTSGFSTVPAMATVTVAAGFTYTACTSSNPDW